MKILIQRVKAGSVTVDGELVSVIKRGYVILFGIGCDDRQEMVALAVNKILNLRLWNDGEYQSQDTNKEEESKDGHEPHIKKVKPSPKQEGASWKKNIMKVNGEILVISQFTLYHKLKGTKPDFHQAMNGSDAEKIYNDLLKQLGEKYEPEKIFGGKFGAEMDVIIRNDGPCTLMIELDPLNMDSKQLKKLNKK